MGGVRESPNVLKRAARIFARTKNNTPNVSGGGLRENPNVVGRALQIFARTRTKNPNASGI